uniref:DUF4216 domain-containing protein n=1 Tax=Chenopodium quinoa TaxID=63459 RepID=A0A803N0A6_CHEQI
MPYFCSRYLHDEFSSKVNRAPRNDDDDTASHEDGSLFPNVGRPLGVKKKNKGKKISLDEDTLMKAHRYVLFNCDEISDYISEHQDFVNRQRSQGRRGKRSRWARAQEHSHDIGACGVSVTSSMSSFASSRDQNPVVGDVKYYGVVEDIIELDYFGHFKVVLFRCKWFQVEQDEFGLTCANFKRLCYTNDPFVMANQVNQVFYVQDSKENHLHYVMETIPGDLFDMNEESNGDVGVSYWNESASDGVRPGATVADDYDVSWLREDLPATTVDVPEYMLEMQAEPEIDESDDEIEDNTLWDFMQASPRFFVGLAGYACSCFPAQLFGSGAVIYCCKSGFSCFPVLLGAASGLQVWLLLFSGLLGAAVLTAVVLCCWIAGCLQEGFCLFRGGLAVAFNCLVCVVVWLFCAGLLSAASPNFFLALSVTPGILPCEGTLLFRGGSQWVVYKNVVVGDVEGLRGFRGGSKWLE